MRHLEAGPPEAALDVEALVGLAAVEDGLVAADLLGDEVERLDEAQAELLALLVLRHRDVLDVAYETQAVDTVLVEREELPSLAKTFHACLFPNCLMCWSPVADGARVPRKWLAPSCMYGRT